jgi:arsenite-transporting ATPase
LRLLLWTGKGGVGTTTVAAATAAHASRCGVKTLLVSLAPDPSLTRVLAPAYRSGAGDRPADAPVVEELEPGLLVARVDGGERARRSLPTLQAHLLPALGLDDADPLVREEVGALPGVDELCSVLELGDLLRRVDADLVVVDGGPTHAVLRLLSLPETLARLVTRLLPMDARIERALARDPGRPGPDHLVDAADRLARVLGGLPGHATASSVPAMTPSGPLTMPGASVRLVTTPETAAIDALADAIPALALFGAPVDGVVVNKVLPAGGDDAWWSRAERRQARGLADVDRRLGWLPTVQLDHDPQEPRGWAALADLGGQMYGDDVESLLATGAQVTARPTVEPADGGFVLALPLPMADRRDVGLARRGEELLLTVPGARRALPLPSALRRCTVTGASLRDGCLRVRFEPDPAQWRSP